MVDRSLPIGIWRKIDQTRERCTVAVLRTLKLGGVVKPGRTSEKEDALGGHETVFGGRRRTPANVKNSEADYRAMSHRPNETSSATRAAGAAPAGEWRGGGGVSQVP